MNQGDGRLTTHVLDTAQGRPAANMAIELWALEEPGDERRLLRTLRTNANGRSEGEVLGAGDLLAGTYELVFDVAGYYDTQEVATASPPFLSKVPVRFTIADPHAHYHVPLLVTPWSYSTYRGS